jgi:septation ring formation regulator EzrA
VSQPENGLTLDVVVQRFADSERALSEIREKLQSLASSAASADASATSLQDSAEAVRGFATTAADAAGELRSVTAQARAVLEGGAALLEGSALRAIEQRLDDLSRTMADSRDATVKELEEIKLRVERIDKGAQRIFTNTLPRRQKKLEYPGE